jgi:hypothetical protein
MKKLPQVTKRLSLSLLIFLLVGEVAIRIFFATTSNNIHQATVEKSEILGWKTKAHHKTTFQTKDQLGKSYTVNYQTKKNGFRTYRNLPVIRQ